MNVVLNMKEKLYLDICSLNRPYDAQDRERVQIETEAVVVVLASIQRGDNMLIGSRALDWENGRCRDVERQAKVRNVLAWAKTYAEVSEIEVARADELRALGFPYQDALHVACAESAKADYLLTTDIGLLKRSERYKGKLIVRVCNPVDWTKAR
jgi:predicted nucleic acid-binding protein